MPSRKNSSDKELAKVRSAIAGLALAGTISLEATAARLETSPRTFQRSLKSHGTTFWALVDQIRFSIAAALLHETDLRVQEIAARLGYSSPSAFARAFTRWSGQTPKACRLAQSNVESGELKWRVMGRSDT